MSDYTAVNAAAMSEGIDALTRASKTLDETLTTLEGELQNSLAKWDGEAQAAYRTAQDNWDKAAAHQQEIVAKMGAVLGQITENYGNTERKITGSWG
jgi:WXG100 family type VII secretion target